MIIDISASGCSFSVAAALLDAECPKRGEDVDLVFRMKEKEQEEHLYKIRATIRRVNLDSERVNLGLHFVERYRQDEEGQQAHMAVLALCETLEIGAAIRNPT